MKGFEEEIGDSDDFLKIVKEKSFSIKEDGYNNDSIKDLKEVFPDKFERLEGTLLNSMGENDLKILKTEFPDNKWKYLTKSLVCSLEYFNSLDDYKKPVNNLQKKTSSVNSK